MSVTSQSVKPSDLAMQQLLQNGLLGSYPVDLVTIATNLGVNVYQAAFTNPSMAGFVVFNPDRVPKGATPGAKATIFVNSNDPVTRRNFTVAHELGHVVLNHTPEDGLITDGTIFRAEGQPFNGKFEKEANEFAASLLMPEQDFKGAFEQYKGDLYVLAARFGVSLMAATVRGNDLNLIDKDIEDLSHVFW